MSTATQGKGQGDLDTVVLKHASGASAEIYLFGATLCSYKSPNGQENIFVSPAAIFDGKKAIRGGVPLVFPQFGQPDKAMAQHGFARSSIWNVCSLEANAEQCVAILGLSDSAETREKWPFAFELKYHVVLTATSLHMTLNILNSGSEAFKFQALLHTYFKIPDIANAAVRGLAGRSYVDKVEKGMTKEETELEIYLPSFTDRVYQGTLPGAKDVTIAKKEGPAMVAAINEATIDSKTEPVDVVVWNPYEEASPGDLPPPAFVEFVCVEPGMVADFKALNAGCCASVSQKMIPV